MSSEAENLKIVKGAYAAMKSGNPEGFFATFAPDAEAHEAASLPYGGVYHGVEGIKRCAKWTWDTFEGTDFEILQFTSGGDLVVVHLSMWAKSKNGNKSWSMPLMEMWRLKDGKVIEIRPFYFDVAKVAEVAAG